MILFVFILVQFLSNAATLEVNRMPSDPIKNQALEVEGKFVPSSSKVQIEILPEHHSEDALFSFIDEDRYYLGRIRFARNESDINAYAIIFGGSHRQVKDSKNEIIVGKRESPIGKIIVSEIRNSQ